MTRLERAREWETIRYYEAWLESRRGYLSPEHHRATESTLRHDGDPTSQNRAEHPRKISRDKALVAFAQLSSLRLNAKRGMVMLVTTSNLYFLAEATQSVSLLTGDQYNEGDELWFGTASIPRSQGISEHVLDAQPHTAKSANGHEYTTPALIIEDCTQDPRFNSKAYAGSGVTFYAGVPIVSKIGFAIGVYNVTDDKPRPGGLTSKELQFMQDMACTIMDHLESIRNDTARYRGERMVLGLGAFTEGHTSLETDTNNNDPSSVIDTPRQSVDDSATQFSFKGITVSETAPKAPKPTPLEPEHSDPTEISLQAQGPPPDSPAIIKHLRRNFESQGKVTDTEPEHGKPSTEPTLQDHSSHSPEYRRTFARAANILRECTDSDGVMFFDGSSASANGLHPGFFSVRRADTNESNTSSDDASYTSGGSSDDLGEHAANDSRHSEQWDNSSTSNSRRKSKAKHCELLGFSFRISNTAQTRGMMLKEVDMRRLLRKYPKGMIMHFKQDGNVSSSEEGNGADEVMDGVLPVLNDKKRAIAQELIKVVPGARSIVWLPLWDFSRSRWAAGCFIWTSRPGRLLSAQEDLTYMKAFANTIMSEINRIEAVASEQAKTSFVANISHELRSPLHGILGSIEFLQDTAVDAFQASMITTVETCGKTLLDTVNHVLDFAKLSNRTKRASSRSKRRLSIEQQPSSLEEEVVDLSRLVEEVIEAVYAGQTFRSTGAFHASEIDKITVDPLPHGQASKQEPARQPVSKFSGIVRVMLDIENLNSWWVRTKPGAIRRIVMNLFGNSLKYTDKGLICVSLSSTEDISGDQSSLGICVNVTDTGKGMSDDFIKHHAWRPFSQENTFATGVGLGLSIVRQITHSLGGEAALRSQQNVGTVATVKITVPCAMAPDESHDLTKIVSQWTNGLKLCLLKPATQKLSNVRADTNSRLEDNLARMATSWFGMNVSTSTTMSDVEPDLWLLMEPPPKDLLFEEHEFGSSKVKAPLIVITPNALESATLRKSMQKFGNTGRNVEFISQPCGPVKFAMAVERCLDRDRSNAGRDASDLRMSVDSGRDSTTIATGRVNAQSRSPRAEWTTMPSSNHPETPKRRKLSHPSSGPSSPTLESKQIDTLMSAETSQKARAVSTTSNDRDSEQSDRKGPILLVDDNEVNLKLLVAFVRKANYAYEMAMDGLQALNLYKEASLDPQRAFKAVVIDIQMPVMDGITATREIRAFELKNDLDSAPAIIVALTGLAGDSTKAECMKAGTDHFLAKPVRFKEFLRLLS